MSNLYNMRVSPKQKAKILISEQGSSAFYSLGTKPKLVEVEEVVVEELEVAVEAVEAPEEVVEEEKSVEDYLSIDDLKVSELKELLDSKGIEYASTKKSDLIALVKLAV